MILLRRFLVVAALMFWQGGFVFYASVVVPIGTETFAPRWYPAPSGLDGVSGKRQQGRITRSVAWWLNAAGVVALLPMGWDVFSGTNSGRRQRWRVLLYLGVVVLQALLMWLYFQLDALFNRDTLRLADENLFNIRHRVYLWLYSVQWSLCVLFLFATLYAWRVEDSQAVQPKKG